MSCPALRTRPLFDPPLTAAIFPLRDRKSTGSEYYGADLCFTEGLSGEKRTGPLHGDSLSTLTPRHTPIHRRWRVAPYRTSNLRLRGNLIWTALTFFSLAPRMKASVGLVLVRGPWHDDISTPVSFNLAHSSDLRAHTYELLAKR